MVSSNQEEDRNMNKKEKVYCPHCGKRLFDTYGGARCDIEIKCAKCRKIIHIEYKLQK